MDARPLRIRVQRARLTPEPTRTRPAFADDGRTRITPALAVVINGNNNNNNNNNNGVSTCTSHAGADVAPTTALILKESLPHDPWGAECPG